MIDLDIILSICERAPSTFYTWEIEKDDPETDNYLEVLVVPFEPERDTCLLHIRSDGTGTIYRSKLNSPTARDYIRNPVTRPLMMVGLKFSTWVENLRYRLNGDTERTSTFEADHLFDVIELLFQVSGFKSEMPEIGGD